MLLKFTFLGSALRLNWVKSCRPFYPLTHIIIYLMTKNQLKTLKMTKNDTEMTNDLQMTLILKITATLRQSWKKHEKLSTFLSSNSYNSQSIDEESIKNVKTDEK